MHEYHKEVKQESESWWSLWGRTTNAKLPHDFIESEADYPRVLANILHHGLNENGSRTLKILQSFGWVNQKKEINVANPALLQAKEIYDRRSVPNQEL